LPAHLLQVIATAALGLQAALLLLLMLPPLLLLLLGLPAWRVA
jgi:hypothetical protein